MPATVVLALLFNRAPVHEQPAASSPTTARPGSASATALPAIPVSPPPSARAAAQYCPALVAALPLRLAGLAPRPVDSPSSYVFAWGEPAVVFRCGVPRPAAFVVGAPNVIAVNGVTWFVQQRPTRAVWTAVDRPVYLELTVPARYDSAPAAALSRTVASTLRAVPPRPGR